MSKYDFPEQEFRERQARTRAAIASAGLDWFLVINPVSLHWLIGSDTKGYTSFQCLPVSARPGRLVMFARETDRNELEDDTLVDEVRGWNGREPEDPMEGFARFVRDLGVFGRVGMEVPSAYLHPHHYLRIKAIFGDALVAERNTLVLDLKLVKSPREQAYVREAARIANAALGALLARVAEGRTELELAAAAFETLLSQGSGLPASTMNLVTGKRCSTVLGAPTTRKQKRGDPGHVEVAAAVRRYTSTIGRVWSLGEPSSRLRSLHEVIRRASGATIAAMRDGVAATVPHEAAKAVFVEAGLDHYRQHTSGYGMAAGFPPSWGEPVNMFSGNSYTLHAGMVVSVEPNLFIHEEQIGVRLIDNVLITPNGAELLSPRPRELVVIE